MATVITSGLGAGALKNTVLDDAAKGVSSVLKAGLTSAAFTARLTKLAAQMTAESAAKAAAGLAVSLKDGAVHALVETGKFGRDTVRIYADQIKKDIESYQAKQAEIKKAVTFIAEQRGKIENHNGTVFTEFATLGKELAKIHKESAGAYKAFRRVFTDNAFFKAEELREEAMVNAYNRRALIGRTGKELINQAYLKLPERTVERLRNFITGEDRPLSSKTLKELNAQEARMQDKAEELGRMHSLKYEALKVEETLKAGAWDGFVKKSMPAFLRVRYEPLKSRYDSLSERFGNLDVAASALKALEKEVKRGRVALSEINTHMKGILENVKTAQGEFPAIKPYSHHETRAYGAPTVVQPAFRAAAEVYAREEERAARRDSRLAGQWRHAGGEGQSAPQSVRDSGGWRSFISPSRKGSAPERALA